MSQDDLSSDIEQSRRIGSSESSSYLAFGYASNWQISLITGYHLIVLATTCVVILNEVTAAMNHQYGGPGDFERSMLIVAFASGTFGGLLQALMSIGKYVGL